MCQIANLNLLSSGPITHASSPGVTRPIAAQRSSILTGDSSATRCSCTSTSSTLHNGSSRRSQCGLTSAQARSHGQDAVATTSQSGSRRTAVPHYAGTDSPTECSRSAWRQLKSKTQKALRLTQSCAKSLSGKQEKLLLFRVNQSKSQVVKVGTQELQLNQKITKKLWQLSNYVLVLAGIKSSTQSQSKLKGGRSTREERSSKAQIQTRNNLARAWRDFNLGGVR
jgi:hypothetical protein